MSTGPVIGLGAIKFSSRFTPPPAVQSGRSSGGGGDSDGGGSSSPLSPVTTPPPSPCPRTKSSFSSSFLENPTARKNKRKLSEPRKRGADLGIKRHCQGSPGGSAMSESGCSDEGGDDGDRTRRLQYRLPNDHDDSSSRSRGPSETEDVSVPGGSNGLTHAAGLQPFFPTGLPSAACFVPGFYLTADARAGFPHPHPPPFPHLPIGLPHPGYAPMTEQRNRTRHALNSDRYRLRPLATQVPPRHAESPDNEDLSGEDDIASNGSGRGRRPRKNYKNMTRERRVEANARERTRVHTISAAFEALRRAVPSYSYNQKLSKLAILKIASTYIMALARLADVDCSQVSEPSIPVSFADCVDLCTTTIQAEGRARRRH